MCLTWKTRQARGTGLQLRLLESGHQVLLTTPEGVISETVAHASSGHAVTTSISQEMAGRIYHFTGELERSARKVRDLVRLYAADWQDTSHAIMAPSPRIPPTGHPIPAGHRCRDPRCGSSTAVMERGG